MKPGCARFVALVVLGSLVGASGCGGPSTVRARDGKVAVYAREYRLDPGRIETAAGPLTIAIRNRGIDAHRLAIGRGRFALARTATLLPGQGATLKVRLPPGRYRLFCSLGNHDTLGLYGSVVAR